MVKLKDLNNNAAVLREALAEARRREHLRGPRRMARLFDFGLIEAPWRTRMLPDMPWIVTVYTGDTVRQSVVQDGCAPVALQAALA